MSISCKQSVSAHRQSQGFSLIELMVALAVGLILIVGLTSLVVGNMQGYGELNKASYQVENARYSSQFLGDELAMAGYYGNLTFLADPQDFPADPCSTSVTDVAARYLIPVQGEDGVSSTSTQMGCVSGMNIKTGTDVLLLRRASTVAILPAARETNKIYLASNISRSDLLAGTTSASLAYLSDPLFARVRRLYERVIYISNCNVCTGSAADTIPTLKMIELLNGSWSDPVPLVEGVDDLQLEYGIDEDEDGAADKWLSLPGNRTQWAQLTAIRFHLLMRNTEETRGYSDSKVYSVGITSSGSARKVGPFPDGFKRHVYSMTVRLHNAAERREG